MAASSAADLTAHPIIFMSTLRSTLLGSAKVRTEIVTLVEPPVSIEVRGATAGVRGRLLNGARLDDGTLDYERYYAQLVVETTYDPETHEPLFTAGDLDAVNALPVHVVTRLAEAAESLSGLGAAAEALEKNSDATESVATDSASPQS